MALVICKAMRSRFLSVRFSSFRSNYKNVRFGFIRFGLTAEINGSVFAGSVQHCNIRFGLVFLGSSVKNTSL